MNDISRAKKWNSLLRLAGFIASVWGMYISAQFSVDGFAFSVDSRRWIGWAMAAIMIVLESVWQKFGGNRTLFILALTCYVYGVFTNVVGMMSNRDGADWTKYVIPVVFGILLEVFPEPVLAWSISGDTKSDPLGKLVDGFTEEFSENKSRSGRFQESFREESDQVRRQEAPGFRPTPKPTFQSMKKSNKSKYHFPFK